MTRAAHERARILDELLTMLERARLDRDPWYVWIEQGCAPPGAGTTLSVSTTAAREAKARHEAGRPNRGLTGPPRPCPPGGFFRPPSGSSSCRECPTPHPGLSRPTQAAIPPDPGPSLAAGVGLERRSRRPATPAILASMSRTVAEGARAARRLARACWCRTNRRSTPWPADSSGSTDCRGDVRQSSPRGCRGVPARVAVLFASPVSDLQLSPARAPRWRAPPAKFDPEDKIRIRKWSRVVAEDAPVEVAPKCLP